MAKFIFVTGGVVSSLGKGIASASIGLLLKSKGLRVTMQKLDPYINVDPGTMSPYQHGEVYVTDDGAETDLDLGHYERFTGLTMRKENNVTSGKIYHSVIQKERRGDYLGGTVQVVPHITNEIKHNITRLAKDNIDVVIVEVGGTVGDIESLPFLEAIRQLRLELGRNNVVNIHVTLVPFIDAAGELKTKPTQHSVGKLREIGIQPEILLCRTSKALTASVRSKIALYCNVEEPAVIQARDVRDIYEVPLMFQEQKLEQLLLRLLGLRSKSTDMRQWRRYVVQRALHPKHETTIAVVGKYMELQDAYKSIYEALRHGGIANNTRVQIRQVAAEEISRHGVEAALRDVHGVLVPGGFGSRGIEGKVEAVQRAREAQIPYLGICLGMHCATIEFARHVCGMRRADSTEFNRRTPHPVISLLEEQRKVKDLGGTMRLGLYPCRLSQHTRAWTAYGATIIRERHRHRYEFNSTFREQFARRGLIVSGIYPQGRLVEIVELADHPWFVACQFHPEFQSRPLTPHPLFRDFVAASLAYNRST